VKHGQFIEKKMDIVDKIWMDYKV